MNCRVCGNPLFAGRATFRCSCGAITHGYCWEKHVLASHEPEFSVGTVDLDGQYAVNEPEPEPEAEALLEAGDEAEAEGQPEEQVEEQEEAPTVMVAEGEAKDK